MFVVFKKMWSYFKRDSWGHLNAAIAELQADDTEYCYYELDNSQVDGISFAIATRDPKKAKLLNDLCNPKAKAPEINNLLLTIKEKDEQIEILEKRIKAIIKNCQETISFAGQKTDELKRLIKPVIVAAKAISTSEKSDGLPLPWTFETEVNLNNEGNWHSIIAPDELEVPSGYSATRTVAETTAPVGRLLIAARELAETNIIF